MKTVAEATISKLETIITLYRASVDFPPSGGNGFLEEAQGSDYSYVFVLETWMFARIISHGTGLIVVQNLMI